MRRRGEHLLDLVLAILVWGLGAASTQATPARLQDQEVEVEPLERARWVVRREDSVVGVSRARQITHPAKVDYDALMQATPEMKTLRREGVDKGSARGLTLVSAAQNRIRRAARSVMTESRHCSVWKRISHERGLAVADITESIRQRLAKPASNSDS